MPHLFWRILFRLLVVNCRRLSLAGEKIARKVKSVN